MLLVAMGAITYGSRVVLLARSGHALKGRIDAFLERFPLALFIALAAATLLVPDADVEPALGYAAFAGAVGGGLLVQRSLPGVLIIGGVVYWLARLITG